MKRTAIVFLALLCAGCIASAAHNDKPASSTPTLILHTGAGDLQIALYADAAPAAVRALRELAAHRGFDGVPIDYTRANIELRSGEVADAGTIENQIDARALGLHEDRVRDRGHAMHVIQRELIPAHRRSRPPATVSPALDEWMAHFYETVDPDFLIGTSRRTINEALGYRYRDGLDSRPVKRGSVALVPDGPNRATTRLSVALADLPKRTGRWMVIGQVVDGLDIADAISKAPLTTPAHIKPRNRTPRDPVLIESASWHSPGSNTSQGD